jgi:Cu(I)/Ag(I) efflux system membrane fusion protein
MATETRKPSSPRAARPRLRILAALLLGVGLGGTAVYAHTSGLLAPLYHALGLHDLGGHLAGHAEAPPAPGGHAGHGGTARPQGGGEPSKLPGYSIVTVPPERQQLIGVRTGKVERDRLLMHIRAVGIIEPDQTRLARIQTRISGWVTKVYVNFVGKDVKKGDPLLELYSPDLLATQEEYLLALEGMAAEGQTAAQKRLLTATRRRLELWGVAPQELEELHKTRKARETLLLRAPIGGRVLERNVLGGSYVEPALELYRIADLSVVWLQAKIYEYELPHIELKQPVHVALLSQPEQEVCAQVSFIEPAVQEMTRTVKVRVAIDNPQGTFLPGMYASLKIDHDMGEGLLVPDSAVLHTGEDRAIAFRVLPEGRFEPVAVDLGGQFGERYRVRSGLKQGDTVVTSAVFLIDAESRLKSAVGMMGGHQHGAAAGQGAEPKPPPGPASGAKKPAAGGHGHHHH